MSRWQALFDDLEASVAAQAVAERAAEVQERARAEFGRLSLADRLRGSTGQPVSMRLAGGVLLAGRVVDVGPDWALLDEDTGQEAVIALRHVETIRGLARHSGAPAGHVASRLVLRTVLRAIARDRSAVRLRLASGAELDARIDRVGADFVEVAAHTAHEPRRRGQARAAEVVPLTAIAAVRRAG